jgi:hypothetical protein
LPAKFHKNGTKLADNGVPRPGSSKPKVPSNTTTPSNDTNVQSHVNVASFVHIAKFTNFAPHVPSRVESDNLVYSTVRNYDFDAEALADPGAGYTFIPIDEIPRLERIKGKKLEVQPSTLGPTHSPDCRHEQCFGQFQAF